MLISVVPLVLLYHQDFLRKNTKYISEFSYMCNAFITLHIYADFNYILVFIFCLTNYNCYMKWWICLVNHASFVLTNSVMFVVTILVQHKLNIRLSVVQNSLLHIMLILAWLWEIRTNCGHHTTVVAAAEPLWKDGCVEYESQCPLRFREYGENRRTIIMTVISA